MVKQKRRELRLLLLWYSDVLIHSNSCLFPFRKGKLVSSLKEIKFASQEERRTRNALIIHQECCYI